MRTPSLLGALSLLAACTLQPVDLNGKSCTVDSDCGDSLRCVESVCRSVLFHEDFESFPIDMGWKQSSVHDNWTVVFTGAGTVGVEQADSHVLSEVPATPTGPTYADSHSALVTSIPTFGDMDLVARIRTVQQLRQGLPPRTYETAWLMWHYTDAADLYYFILKTNGWELGKKSGSLNSIPLATGARPAVQLGNWQSVRIRQVGATISIFVDGSPIPQFTDANAFTNGSLALTGPDAYLQIDDIEVREP